MNPNDPQRSGLRVVVAEDSPTQAELLRQTLSDEGYEVTVAANGLEALEAARAQKPALVLTDVVMPDMDGYALCRAVKADPALRDVPVMIVTALNQIEDVVMALESGADNFIRKPFEPRALLARLDFLLANRQLRAQDTQQAGIEISVGGRRHVINAGREQILDLLFSSYEEALQANEELRERQREVQTLNLQLAGRAVALEEANEQLRSFSHTVSHDLRSPLGTIGGFSTVLANRYAERLDERGLRYLNAIRQETERMVRIVEDVLYLANIDRARVTRTRVDLAQVAREIVETLQDAQPERRVCFECVPQAPVDCDPRLARIALGNLLGNAWKFTGKRPDARIALSVQPGEDGEPEYVVEDNGAGFDMSAAHRLFKPFERLHRNDEFEGFGVGLATVHRIVTLHGGWIRADSAPGQGARFYFTLGLAAEGSEPGSERTSSPRA
ncbi:MAG TPA: response regulator [Ramlibacter sp.]|uniref:sensor histidine kinase n=1 Tax=Ramlibacter sp. TaxID=1917967 RepID=UPI002D80823A|nr:response regulator [Ramlibacter sp.]HET8745128.1 response regulator [Ramlibacter sp.]